MDSDPQGTVTRLLEDARSGEPAALDRLLPRVYAELERLARRARRSGRGGETLDTRALVHEAYLRLAERSPADWRSHDHFAAVAALAMRHILIDYARRKSTAKRGENRRAVQIDQVAEIVPDGAGGSDEEDLLALDRALARLEAIRPRQARIVELRFFGGRTIEETAAALGVSRNTVKRGWAAARAWLYREMTGSS